MYAYYRALVTGNAALSGAINVSRAAVGVEATSAFTGGGSPVAAPAANAAIASIAGLTSGTYEVEISAFITGTTVAALESSNMNFRIGGVASGVILVPVPGTSGANACGIFRTRINVAGPITISVNAIAAATASSSYVASIVAQKIGF